MSKKKWKTKKIIDKIKKLTTNYSILNEEYLIKAVLTKK